jgi:hypothetical protein
VPAVPGSAAREQRRNVSHPGTSRHTTGSNSAASGRRGLLGARRARPVPAGPGQYAAQVLDHFRGSRRSFPAEPATAF